MSNFYFFITSHTFKSILLSTANRDSRNNDHGVMGSIIKKLLKSYKLSSKNNQIINLAHLLYLFKFDKRNLPLSYPVLPKESDLTILMVQVILLSDYLGVIF